MFWFRNKKIIFLEGILFSGLEFTNCLSIANREDPDQTALSDLCLHCLSLLVCPFKQATSVYILEYLL